MAPPRKRAKKENTVKQKTATAQTIGVNTDCSNSGEIVFEVDNVSKLDGHGRDSPTVEIGGLPWCASVQKVDYGIKQCIRVSLVSMHHNSSDWRIMARFTISIRNFIANSNNGSITPSSSIDPGTMTHSFRNGLNAWEKTFKKLGWDIMDEKKGFVKDDKLTVDIFISILNVEGILLNHPLAASVGSSIGIMNAGKLELVTKESLLSFMTTASVTTIEQSTITGFISFEVQVFDGPFRNHSENIEVCEMQWAVETRKRRESSYLEVSLYNCDESSSNIWSLDLIAEFTLICHTRREDSFAKKVTKNYRFDYYNDDLGLKNFILWDDLINEEKGFIKDGKFTLTVQFTLFNIKGIRIPRNFDFSDANDPLHDMTLIIEGQKVHVSKQILALQSPVFNSMFYGNMSEAGKSEVELKDIDRAVFVEMLYLIYPSYQKITDENLEPLLKMADYFQVKMVLDELENYILESNLSIPTKLRLSDQFRLVDVQDQCLGSFTTVQEIYSLKTTEEYKSLSDKSKSALMDKAMRLA